MRSKPSKNDFGQEENAQLDAIRAKIGEEVPLSLRYAFGQRARLVAIEDGLPKLAHSLSIP